MNSPRCGLKPHLGKNRVCREARERRHSGHQLLDERQVSRVR